MEDFGKFELEILLEENKMLRKALEEYADESSWHNNYFNNNLNPPREWPEMIWNKMEDGFVRAKKALGY